MLPTSEVRAIALRMLKSSYYLFSNDLENLPEEAFSKSFGPACRTVADIVYEVNLVNDHIGLTIRREDLFDFPKGLVEAPADFRTKVTIIAAFKQSFERFIATIEGFAEEDMLVPIPDGDGDGGETNRFERCRFVALHNWYHSGQLNFIQTLLGDDAVHW